MQRISIQYRWTVIRRNYNSSTAIAKSVQTQSISSNDSFSFSRNSSSAEELINSPEREKQGNNSRSLPSDAKKSRKRIVRANDDSIPERSTSELNSVDLFLASLRAEGKEPTLDDIERCRPTRHSPEHSPEYANEYSVLTDRLCRTFSKEQLRNFTLSYNLDRIWTRSGRRKFEYAQSIIEKQWGWPNLKEIERHKRDTTEVVVRSFPVHASELFLLLGPDGSALLQMSLQYNVHISVTPDPLSLQVEGLRGSLKQIEALISTKKKAIVERTVELPSKSQIRPDLLQRISRLSVAFIENVGSRGKIRIRANSDVELEGAERLAIRAAAYENYTSCIIPLFYVPSGDNSTTKDYSYSFFPFLPQRLLPWTMKMGVAFRVRKIHEWSNQFVEIQNVETPGLAQQGRLLDSYGNASSIKSMLMGALPLFPKPEVSRTVTASTGHVLFTSHPSSLGVDLTPPLSGSFDISMFLNWVLESGAQRTFVPSLPVQLHKAPLSRQEIVHQLVYRSVPLNTHSSKEENYTAQLSRTLKFETVLTRPATPKGIPKEQHAESQQSGFSDWLPNPDKLMHNKCDSDVRCASEQVQPHDEYDTESSSTSVDVKADVLCLKSDHFEYEFLLLDRPMDLKLLVQDSVSVHVGGTLVNLKNYFDDLKAFLKGDILEQPNPPLHLFDGTDHYTLETNSSLRRSRETVKLFHNVGSPSESQLRNAFSTVTESILDLETDQKSTTCSIICDDPLSEERWIDFLHHCDKLTEWGNFSKSDIIF